MSRLIETGTKLELKKVRYIESATEISYVSRFLYQTSVDEAVIEMPTKAGVLVPLEPGEAFQLCFYTNKGLYQCQAQVVSRYYEDALPVAVIKLRSEFEKLQRRQYYRMESVLPLEFRVVSETELEQMWREKSSYGTNAEEDNTEKKELSGGIRYYTGVTIDISGGGVRFNSEFAAQSDDILVMRVAFLSPETQKIQPLFAKVLTVLPVPNRSGIFEHRVEYTAISNSERECIIRYIFTEERKRRRKETGIE